MVFYQIAVLCYLVSVLFSLPFALLLRGKDRFPSVRKTSFLLEGILQAHN